MARKRRTEWEFAAVKDIGQEDRSAPVTSPETSAPEVAHPEPVQVEPQLKAQPAASPLAEPAPEAVPAARQRDIPPSALPPTCQDTIRFILEKIDVIIEAANQGICDERLAGNIVKEEYWKGERFAAGCVKALIIDISRAPSSPRPAESKLSWKSNVPATGCVVQVALRQLANNDQCTSAGSFDVGGGCWRVINPDNPLQYGLLPDGYAVIGWRALD